MQTADIEHRFAFHAALDQACARAAHDINALLPDGREKSTAITKLEEAMFWANAGLARGSEVRF